MTKKIEKGNVGSEKSSTETSTLDPAVEDLRRRAEIVIEDDSDSGKEVKVYLENEIHNKSIISSIKFLPVDGILKQFTDGSIAAANREFRIDDKYRNAYFIFSEHSMRGNRSDLAGLDDALEILARDRSLNVILFGFLSVENIVTHGKGPRIRKFLGYENTAYKQLPCSVFEMNDKESVLASLSGGNQAADDLLSNWDSRREVVNLDESLRGATVFVDDGSGYFDGKLIMDTVENSHQKYVFLTDEFTEEEIVHGMDNLLFFGYAQTYLGKIPKQSEDFKEMKISTSTQVKFVRNSLEVAKQHFAEILHTLQGVKDPYNPKSEEEQWRVNKAFQDAQSHFPGLDTMDKFLDFILHVDLEIPEVMSGQEIDGVYADIDGTLIEYVGIHSGKEGTQQLRNAVVELLKKYESEGKEIVLWTGGNVKEKEAYLRSLGIHWPVVSKYDYAGAIAEIVIDDTDQNSFIAQSKIYPTTYIDTSGME